MTVQIGDFLFVSSHDVETLHGPDDLRRFLEGILGPDLTNIERHLKELGYGGVYAIRLRPSPPQGLTVNLPRGVPLRDLVGAQPLAPAIPPQVVPEPEAWFEVVLFTDDGVPIPDVKLRVYDQWGFDQSGVTDAEGRLHLKTPNEGRHKLELLDDLIKLPVPPTEPTQTEGYDLRRDQSEYIELSDNKAHTLVVQRPRATVLGLDGWWENQKVMVFQGARQTDFGPVTVRGILRQAMSVYQRGQEVHVVGHADTKGGTSDNDALALERAKSVYLFLSGKRQEWAEHAHANADDATMQAALYWIGMNTLVECDPGPVDGDWGPASDFGLMMLRIEAGLPPNGPRSVDDWAAIFDHFDQALADLMYLDRSGLNDIRTLMTFTDPESKGERFPVDAPDLNDYESPVNRRVDIVFCDYGATPQPNTDELYDKTFVLRHLVVEPEWPVKIIVTKPSLEPLPFACAHLQIGPLGLRRFVADPAGLIELVVLRNDRIQVLFATDPGGTGKIINGGLKEAAGILANAMGIAP